jgi:hypothetical protein
MNHFDTAAESIHRAALIAHLGRKIFFLRKLLHRPRFPNSLSERLLNVGMLA